MVLAIVAAVVVLGLLADRLASRIPFSFEVALASRYAATLPAPSAVGRRLQALADELAGVMDLPDGMGITVHYLDDDTVNAFATLGGNIVVYRGILEKLPHENALAMLLAHEMAHVRQRHPIRSLGRGAVAALAAAALLGLGENRIAERVMGEAGLLTLLRFSRDQERAADRAALAAVAKRYGHVSGASALFEVLLDGADAGEPQGASFMRTHPLTRERIADLAAFAQANGWPTGPPVTGLGPVITALEPR